MTLGFPIGTLLEIKAMQLATTSKPNQRHKESTDNTGTASHQTPEVKGSMQAGMPLFLQCALSDFAPSMIQRQPVEDEEETLQMQPVQGAVQGQPIEEAQLLQRQPLGNSNVQRQIEPDKEEEEPTPELTTTDAVSSEMWPMIQAKLTVGHAHDAFEQEADCVAQQFMSGQSASLGNTYTSKTPHIYRHGLGPGFTLTPAQQQAIHSVQGNGQTLISADRAAFENHLGHDLSGIRMHRGPNAGEAANALGASAFTIGSNVVLGSNAPEPGSDAGRQLLAHELTHAVQQGAAPPLGTFSTITSRMGAPSVQRFCDPANQSCPEESFNESSEEPFGECIDPALALSVPQPEGGSLPDDFCVEIQVAPPPAIEGQQAGELEELALSLPVPPISEERTDLYAVPIEYVFRTQVEANSAQCRSDGGELPIGPIASTGSTPTIGASTPTPILTGGTEDSGNAPTPVEPDTEPTTDTYLGPVSAGDTVYTGDGPIELVSATTNYIVTTTYTKFAVGAGSTTLVRTDTGLILVDAGMHQVGGAINDALADATVVRLEAAAGGEAITEVIITHMHADHTALLPRIYARFEIGTLRVNALQALLLHSGGGTRLEALVRQMGAARIAHVTDQVRRELETTGGSWDNAPNAEERQRQLNAAVTVQASSRLAAMQPTQVMLNIPSGGQVVAANMPLGNIAIPEGLTPDGTTITQPLNELGMVTILDPTAGAEVANIVATGEVSGSATIDAQSTTYVLDIQGGTRLFVISDQRTDEIPRLRFQLEAALTTLGRPANLQILDVTHHLQQGWISRTGMARASQLAQVTRMLSDLAAQSAAGGASSALVVSVYGDPDTPSAPNYVDPASRWILEALGFHVIPATGGGSTLSAAQDISVLEVALAEEVTVSGIASGRSMGMRPNDPLLQHAHAAQRLLEVDTVSLRAELATDLSTEQRAQVQDNLTATENQIMRIQQAVELYVAAVERDIGRGIRSSRPAVAPPVGSTAPAQVEADALRVLIAGTDSPTGTDPRLTATALVVIGQEQLASLDPGSRELLAARYQVRAAAAQLRAWSPQEEQQRAADALERYRAALNAAIVGAPAGSAQILRTEFGRVNRDISTVTGLSQPDLTALREAAALADQVGRNAVQPLSVESPAGLTEPETLRRIETEHGGLATLHGQLYRITSSGDSVQTSMVPLRTISVPRATRSLPSGGSAGDVPPALPALRSAGRPRSNEPIVVPGEVPLGLATHPNIINISGRPIVLGSRTIQPTRWTPMSAVQPGEFVVRGYSQAWIVVHPQTGQPIAGAAMGGEMWRVEANGTWTLMVNASGAVRAPRSPAITSRGDPAEAYGGRHPGATETTRARAGGRITGGGVVAGVLAILMVAQEIMGPIGRILNQERYNLQMARARLQFWQASGADPSHQMRTGVHDVVRPAETEATTSALGDPVYHTVTHIDVAALSRNLPNIIQTYQNLILWLDMGKQLQAIRLDPPMPREPTANDRAAPRQVQAIVAGDSDITVGQAGDRRAVYQDITSIIEDLERRTLADTEAQMRARVGGWSEQERGNIFRLKAGAQTPVYRTARGGLIRSAAHLFGTSPRVRVIDRAEGGAIGWFFQRRPYSDRVKVVPANADAERSTLVSAYQISDDIESVLEEVQEGGREIIKRHPESGRLESFVAGPMPGSDRFGMTRYYRHQQQPNIWTVAIGQLNQFWVDADQIEPVDHEVIENYVQGTEVSQ